MRILTVCLIAMLALLQYDFWLGKNSVSDYFSIKQQVVRQSEQNQQLEMRNRVLTAEINDLRHGDAAIEEHARTELGMIRQGETFYRFIPKK